MKDQVIVVDEDGETLTTLYDDRLAPLGALEIARASNVEYGITPGVKGWEVELSQDARLGPYRGLIVVSEDHAHEASLARGLAAMGKYNGFATRAEALAVEVRFLNKNILRA